MDTIKLLTKSRYVNGLRCSKWLWLEFNRPEEIPAFSKEAQYRFNEGHQVGEFAKKLFPDGIQVMEQLNPVKNDSESRELLKKRKTLFEAGFIHQNGLCYARSDILVPINSDEWDLYEVKGATEVKEQYIWDVSFQNYIYKSIGLKIRNCFVLHVNNQYIKRGSIEPKEFFLPAPVDDEVNEEIGKVERNIKKMLEIISSKECQQF